MASNQITGVSKCPHCKKDLQYFLINGKMKIEEKVTEEDTFRTLYNKVMLVGVDSGVIHSIAYHRPSNILFVVFHDNSVYAYKEVDGTTFIDFVSAPSKGGYFSKYIKRQYNSVKIY